MKPALLGRGAKVSPADDELTELLAELLVRAWRRRHPGEPTTGGARSEQEAAPRGGNHRGRDHRRNSNGHPEA